MIPRQNRRPPPPYSPSSSTKDAAHHTFTFHPNRNPTAENLSGDNLKGDYYFFCLRFDRVTPAVLRGDFPSEMWGY